MAGKREASGGMSAQPGVPAERASFGVHGAQASTGKERTQALAGVRGGARASLGECAGKVAVVTGASRGIGAAIARRLASAGASVAVLARSVDSSPPNVPGTLRDVVGLIAEAGGNAIAIGCDVMDRESRRRAIASCAELLGPIDILVNNAAYGRYRPFEQFSERDVRLTFEANVAAPLELSQLVIPYMRAKGAGWILNISSATAEHPAGPPFIAWEQMGGHMLYGATKAALNRLSTGLAAELFESRIAVNALAPVAAVLTPGVEAMGIAQWLEPSMIEPVEAMAEAALALCCCDPQRLTGRVAYSVKLLADLGRPIRTLDGSALYEGPLPAV
jgi:NAD(P)-dependent dehydrogenase (short-subunit alcohol dehydrogenase family)